MQESKMKNILILKDLNSNIIDEAIVILSKNYNSNKILKEYSNIGVEDKDKGDKRIKSNSNSFLNSDSFIIKEAKLLINNYLEKTTNKENLEKIKINNQKISKQRKYLKICVAIILIQFCIIIL